MDLLRLSLSSVFVPISMDRVYFYYTIVPKVKFVFCGERPMNPFIRFQIKSTDLFNFFLDNVTFDTSLHPNRWVFKHACFVEAPSSSDAPIYHIQNSLTKSRNR